MLLQCIRVKKKKREGPQVVKRRKCDEGTRRDAQGRRRGEEMEGGDGYGHDRKGDEGWATAARLSMAYHYIACQTAS